MNLYLNDYRRYEIVKSFFMAKETHDKSHTFYFPYVHIIKINKVSQVVLRFLMRVMQFCAR